MTKEQADADIQTIKKIIEDKGFIFTNGIMTGPVALGNLDQNELVNVLGEDANDSDQKIALEAGTFYLNYDFGIKSMIPNITSPIFQNGPDDKIKRFSLYTLQYQIHPLNTYPMDLVAFRGSFW